jgi:hypothetical protein
METISRVLQKVEYYESLPNRSVNRSVNIRIYLSQGVIRLNNEVIVKGFEAEGQKHFFLIASTILPFFPVTSASQERRREIQAVRSSLALHTNSRRILPVVDPEANDHVANIRGYMSLIKRQTETLNSEQLSPEVVYHELMTLKLHFEDISKYCAFFGLSITPPMLDLDEHFERNTSDQAKLKLVQYQLSRN